MYYLLLIFLYPLSLLPLPVLYVLSDAVYGLLYYVMGYRKQIVWDNLRKSFPDKTDEEIHAIRKKFYRSFCDQWIETLKLLSMSKASLRKRMQGNWEVLQQLNEKGKDCYLLTGHTYNWEWANAATAMNTPQKYACVYLPLSNTAFDRLMLKIRTRTGALMISMKALKSGLKELQGHRFILGLAADQNPAVTETATWISFMHQEAPFFRGPEQMPRRAKAAVVTIGIRKIKRGYYKANLRCITEDASLEPADSILPAYVRFIEEQLEAQPENYLWSHRRWKHKRVAR